MKVIIRIFLLIISAFFFFLGLLFLLSAFSNEAISQGKMLVRLFFGGLVSFAGLMFLIFAFLPLWTTSSNTKNKDLSQQEAPGQLNLKKVKCPNCGAEVDPSTTTLSPEGSLVIKCSYCGGTFMVDESPKW